MLKKNLKGVLCDYLIPPPGRAGQEFFQSSEDE